MIHVISSRVCFLFVLSCEADEKYPMQREMEGYAAALGITLKQVKGWFVERRRRDKRDNGIKSLIHSTEEKNAGGLSAARKNPKGLDLLVHNRSMSGAVLYSRYRSTPLVGGNMFDEKNKEMLLPQDLLSPQYILKKVFRKDGPPLGVEFDSLPSESFSHCKGIHYWKLILCCLSGYLMLFNDGNYSFRCLNFVVFLQKHNYATSISPLVIINRACEGFSIFLRCRNF